MIKPIVYSTGMKNKLITLPRLRCQPCGHEWTPRQPKVWVCPKCHSPKWDEAKGK